MTRHLTTRIKLSFLALLALVPAVSAAQPPPRLELVRSVINKHVIPHIESLRAAAAQLPDAVDNVCRTGSPAASAELSKRFDKVVEAYAGVDFLRFGPMLEGGRRERLSFWPDPRGFVGRQLRLLLVSKDASVLQPGAIKKQSVAVQGLPALETLMQDKDVPLGPAEAARFRCGVAKAITLNVVSDTGDIIDGWEKPGGWKDKMLNTGPANDTYKSADESAVELVKAFLVGMSLTADLQLKPEVDPKVKLTPPYQKSGLQKAYYAATIASLHEFYRALRLEDYLKPDKAWMKNWLSGAWRSIESSDGVGGRAPNAERADAPPLREVFDKMNGMRNLVSNQLSVDAGLTVGFNELDGD